MHYAAIHVTCVLIGILANRPSGISQAAATAVNHTKGVNSQRIQQKTFFILTDILLIISFVYFTP